MPLIHIVAMLAVAQYFFFMICVAKARGRYRVKAPATTGNEHFERIYRVQMNTMELLVVLLPTLYIAVSYLRAWWVALAGAVYLLGRFIYWRAYVIAPASRALGFGLSALPIMLLALTTLGLSVVRLVA